jgi:hypothetical protein
VPWLLGLHLLEAYAWARKSKPKPVIDFDIQVILWEVLVRW